MNEGLSDRLVVSTKISDTLALLARHDAAPAGEKRRSRPERVELWRKAAARHNSITIEGDVLPNSVLDFFRKLHNLRDHRLLNEKEQQHTVDVVKNLGTERLENYALAYIATVERRCFAATHQQSQADEVAKAKAIEERDRLAALIREFLGVVPLLDLDQQPRLFGRPVPEANLSRGQTSQAWTYVTAAERAARARGDAHVTNKYKWLLAYMAPRRELWK